MLVERTHLEMHCIAFTLLFLPINCQQGLLDSNQEVKSWPFHLFKPRKLWHFTEIRKCEESNCDLLGLKMEISYLLDEKMRVIKKKCFD